MRLRKLLLLLSLTVLVSNSECLGAGGPKVNVVVKTILASSGPRYVDPRLSGLVQELESVFRYSSYRLLDINNMSLGLNEIGTAPLPGDRALKITPLRIAGGRVSLRLVIFKEGRQIFESVIQLLNRSSITVGGPEHRGGYLLFNIFSEFFTKSAS